ncbi:MAG: hypothetical protein K2X26_05790 [Chitinophagaceae bacterium]|nr:hypothetical protein [Chitinophagaceae bacterium]
MTEKSSSESLNKLETFRQAQTAMCNGYANGSIGIIVSGLIWLTSAIIAYQYSAPKAIWALFIGGMFIYPLSMLISKLIGLAGTHNKGNELGNLAMEGTIWMIMCIPLAFGLSLQQVEWFFQAMLLIIGGRYLTFNTIYGNKIYWVLGAILGLSAYLLYNFKAQSFETLLTGSFIEISFGLFMFISFHRDNKTTLK